jgi:prepilin-type N-terminal cleavage/methylation domain-containing protein
MRKMRKAFTLIELLVVIAIIAILAAILFPVFAKAKESAKKAKNLSGFKQLSLSVTIYMTDYDDTFPQAFTRRYALMNNAWDVIHPIPHNWKRLDAYWSTVGGLNQGIQQWSNSTQPYAKNWGIHDDTGFNLTKSTADAADFADPLKPAQPASQNLAFNGLLHTLTTSDVNLISSVPMLWGGYGKGAYLGRSIANPTLYCSPQPSGSAPPNEICRFNPTGRPAPSAPAGAAWFWTTGASGFVWGEGMNFAFCDTSAKFRAIGRVTGGTPPNYPEEPNRDYYNTPFAHILAGGRPATMWFCTISGATASYPCMFRPDKTQT